MPKQTNKEAGTWLDDIKAKDPKLYEAYKLVGNQGEVPLRNMVRALSTLTLLNTPEDNARLEAAKYILRNKNRKKGGVPPTNQDTADVLEGSLPEVSEAHGKVDDNTGITCPKTELPSKLGGLVTAGIEEYQQSDDDAADELELEHIAELVRDGYTSGYHPSWSLSMEEGLEPGPDSPDMDEIARMISKGYTSGYHPYWELKRGGKVASKTAADMSTSRALKLAEDLVEDLQALYLKAKPINQVNESRSAREGVEAIFVAMSKMSETTKLLSKQLRQEEQEEEAVEAEKKRTKKSSIDANAPADWTPEKKATFGGLKIAESLEEIADRNNGLRIDYDGIDAGEAYDIASQWGSYMHSGDPGAVFYTFPMGDAVVVDEDHRKALIEHTNHCIAIQEQRIKDNREGTHTEGEEADPSDQDEKDLEDLFALRDYFENAPIKEKPEIKVDPKLGGLKIAGSEGGPAGSPGKRQASKGGCGECGHSFEHHNRPADFSCDICDADACHGWSDEKVKKANNSSRKDRVEFAHLLQQHAPKLQDGTLNKHVASTIAEEIMRLGHAYKNIQHLWLGEPMDPESQAKFQNKEHEIEDRIQGFAAQLGVTILFDGDPSKPTIRILCPDGFSNDAENQGICVPTA